MIALVELDMRNMRVRVVVAGEAIRERMRELEHPEGIPGMRRRDTRNPHSKPGRKEIRKHLSQEPMAGDGQRRSQKTQG